MEEAVLKTLLYRDIFDYPLKAWEIQKWLIKKEATLSQVEKTLQRLLKKKRIETNKGFYFLPGRKSLVTKRLKRERISNLLLKQNKLILSLTKFIPSLLLVGISGSLAVKNSDDTSDIDLFIVTQKNRVWLSRLFVLGLFSLLGIRRKRKDTEKKAAKKICVNIILEISNLEQKNKTIYVAHEVLQMQLLWQKENTYSRFLEANQWVFSFIPNWHSTQELVDNLERIKKQPGVFSTGSYLVRKIGDGLELVSRKWQHRIMETPQGMETISNQGVYFHPEDYGQKVIELFTKRCRQLL